MPPSRQAMIAALKSTVVPYLRERGYRGSFPHLRRTSASGVDLITFQFDRNGGGFIVEVAACPLEGITTHWGKVIGPSKVTAWDLHPEQRTRIKPRDGAGTESWFRYDSGDYDSVARETLILLVPATAARGASA